MKGSYNLTYFFVKYKSWGVGYWKLEKAGDQNSKPETPISQLAFQFKVWNLKLHNIFCQRSKYHKAQHALPNNTRYAAFWPCSFVGVVLICTALVFLWIFFNHQVRQLMCLTIDTEDETVDVEFNAWNNWFGIRMTHRKLEVTL